MSTQDLCVCVKQYQRQDKINWRKAQKGRKFKQSAEQSASGVNVSNAWSHSSAFCVFIPFWIFNKMNISYTVRNFTPPPNQNAAEGDGRMIHNSTKTKIHIILDLGVAKSIFQAEHNFNIRYGDQPRNFGEELPTGMIVSYMFLPVMDTREARGVNPPPKCPSAYSKYLGGGWCAEMTGETRAP